MIPVTDTLAIEDDEISEKFVRASGPGGQHVNTSSSAVELRFDARNSPSLPDDVKHRLERIAGSRMNQDGVIVIFAQSHRSQEMNRQDARARLVDLIDAWKDQHGQPSDASIARVAAGIRLAVQMYRRWPTMNYRPFAGRDLGLFSNPTI